MKGYAQYRVTSEARLNLGKYIRDRDNFVRNFDRDKIPKHKRTRKTWFGFGKDEEYYVTCEPDCPEGVYLWVDLVPRKAGWLQDLEKFQEMFNASDTVWLDQDASDLLLPITGIKSCED